MIVQTLTIARNAFVESLRQPIMLLLTLGAGVLQVFNTWNTGFAMGLEETGEVQGDNKMLLDVGLATVFVMATLLAAFIATATLSREIENKTALTVVSKPVGRPTVILGKYLGVSGAILLSVGAMIIFLLIAIRHGVLSNASDTVDGPTVLFGLGAVGLSLVLAGWCNFFYGWNFSQVAMVLLTPSLVVGYVLLLNISPKWAWQDMSVDFKPQITMACCALTLGTLVLTSVALAASARLNQVMTIFVCLGVFLASLLTNYFVGRFAYSNTDIGIVVVAAPTDPTRTAFDSPGDSYILELRKPPDMPVKPGESIYYGSNGSGFDLAVPAFRGFEGDVNEPDQLFAASVPAALVVTKSDGKSLTVRHIGGRALSIRRPPAVDDFVFTKPTRVNFLAMPLWAVLPNMHYFWLLDAVSQNEPVPLEYVLEAMVHAGAMITVFLSLAVILFQKRDVG
ncbi:MAG: ABC transporter permease [Planctomycetota bacterium]